MVFSAKEKADLFALSLEPSFQVDNFPSNTQYIELISEFVYNLLTSNPNKTHPPSLISPSEMTRIIKNLNKRKAPERDSSEIYYTWRETISVLVDTGSSVSLFLEDVSTKIVDQQKFSKKCIVLSGVGLEIECHKSNLKIVSQKGYAREILQRLEFDGCKPVAQPMLKDTGLLKSGAKSSDFPYKQDVGALMYQMVGTRQSTK
ncbi:hypothetical protein NPIL_251031 [Nephila pilipes]|uniref:Peptidase A2 domain-containing protein n=1 Tax=Nephila pilipes TaxID=299642 RepID=A0A8X6MQC5_NEPPI|nr:hypothetical protein NPIL_251031 [Nephila pilipes]